MHIQAEPLSEFGGGGVSICTGDNEVIYPAIDPKLPINLQDMIKCKSPIKSPATESELLSETLVELKRHNVRRAVTMGDLKLVTEWTAAGKGRLIPALNFSDRDQTPGYYRKLYAEGRFKLLVRSVHNIEDRALPTRSGSPTLHWQKRSTFPLAFIWAKARPEACIPLGPPTYRVALGNPLLLEDLLVRHPKLRVYVMHYGSPLVDEMIAMMYSHPNLYVDISRNNWLSPRKQFYEQLIRMVEAGFEKRILFGSNGLAESDRQSNSKRRTSALSHLLAKTRHTLQ